MEKNYKLVKSEQIIEVREKHKYKVASPIEFIVIENYYMNVR